VHGLQLSPVQTKQDGEQKLCDYWNLIPESYPRGLLGVSISRWLLFAHTLAWLTSVDAAQEPSADPSVSLACYSSKWSVANSVLSSSLLNTRSLGTLQRLASVTSTCPVRVRIWWGGWGSRETLQRVWWGRTGQ
jgi:hypothetical protein